MIPYPIPMQVHVIWHPEDDALCRPLAERIYLTLNRDPHQPLLPGIGIPVFFRCAGADPQNVGGPPLPISVADTKLDLRIAFVTENLAVDRAWRDYLDVCGEEVDRKPQDAALIAFDMSAGALDGDRLSVRLDCDAHRLREQLMLHVLLQCCRLLGGRTRGERDEGRGAAPLKLFISHTKRDPEGLEIASAIKAYLDTLAVERFFDAVSIQPGDRLSAELEGAIADSAIVCIRTDSYVSSSWCRRELLFGKRAGRPMVVIDALAKRERRASALLSQLPSLRMTPDQLDRAQIEDAISFIMLEVVGFLHSTVQLTLLQKAGLVPADAVLLTRPPELRDLAALTAGVASPTFLYPDPMLPAEEASVIETFGAILATPTSFWRERLDNLPLGLSLSPGDCQELRALGLDVSLHIEDAMRMMARQFLAAGATLHYGGALFPGSLTEALFEMIGAYNRTGLALPPLINHTPWPWDEDVDKKWEAARLRMLEMDRIALPPDVAPFAGTAGKGHVGRLSKTADGRYALGRSLTEMRRKATQATHARVVLGGKAHSFVGLLPGIFEEVILSIDAGRAVFILGGFGGASRLIGRALLGEQPAELTRTWQEERSPDYKETLAFCDEQRAANPGGPAPLIDYDSAVRKLNAHGIAGLAATNGLDEGENRFLLHTASVDTALYLVMKGLVNLQSTIL